MPANIPQNMPPNMPPNMSPNVPQSMDADMTGTPGALWNTARIAVLLPCYNEEAAVVKVVQDFRAALPEARIYVFDNNSSDRTAELARKAGATVIFVKQPGKGNVVRRMFADVDADYYVMADGDATYDAPSARAMLELCHNDQLDMVVACRRHTEDEAYRPGHVLGNRLLTGTVQLIFGQSFTDMLSGYRVFSRRYAKTFPCFSKGFEIETEMSVHALQMRLPVGETTAPYFARPENSTSKLNTYKDGWRILCSIINLFMLEKPRIFFGMLAAFMLVLAFALSVPLFITWLQSGLVPRFPTAILCSGMVLLSFVLLSLGFMLDGIKCNRQQNLRLAYLKYSHCGGK